MTLSESDLLDRIPLETTVTLGGKEYRSEWLGGIDENHVNRFGVIWDVNDVDPDFTYLVAEPPGAVDIRTLTDTLVDEGWRFYSANGADYAATLPTVHADFLTPPDYAVDFDGISTSTEPATQHAVLCDLTGAYRSSGGYALYSCFSGSIGAVEADALGSDVAAEVSDGVVVLVVDGTGSMVSSDTTTWIGRFFDAYEAACPGNTARLVVTKFSDYTHPSVGPGYGGNASDVPAVRLGVWTGIVASNKAAVQAAVAGLNTGSGGDENESQFEGIWAGMQDGGLATGTGSAQGLTGSRAIVVYTDAASAVGWAIPAGRVVGRKYPRNDQGRHWPRTQHASGGRRAGGYT